ncbi:hypothetical protein Agub_g9523 [Astrephomene gubernaculifera]|uniref:Methyltransferase domain-containing protein n=1 Tax=Astrephomene gubernaculifera TaxID=47775 RepID=A0AAD3DTV5_9CHLO|nr:hypothetical protein Agub_g9523 [Astrephomene gubernaculifera]
MDYTVARAAAQAARRFIGGPCAVLPIGLCSVGVLAIYGRHVSSLTSVQQAPSGATAPASSTPAPLPYPSQEYKELVIQAFDSVSRSPDANADPLSDQLARRTIVHAQLGRGSRVIDIASGVGLLLIPAARAVGNTGSVLGLDLSPGMVEQARRNIQASRLRNAEVRQADVETLELPRASYDVALCSASLPYMSDPGRALERWRGWLRPSGRLVLNCFQSPFDPEAALFYQLAARHGLGDMLRDPLACVGSRGRLQELLEGAGYRRVQVTEERVDMLAPAASARAYAEAMWESSCSSPHHDIARLTRCTASSTGNAGSSSSSSIAGSGGVNPAGAAAGGVTAPVSSTSAAPAQRSQQRGSSAAVAAAAAARAGRQQAAGGRGEPPPLGLRPRTSPNLSSSVQSPAARQGQAAGAGAAAGGTAGPPVESAGGISSSSKRAVDPEALAAFREAFLAAAERSVQGRLRSGAVRTSVTVLYGVAHAI